MLKNQFVVQSILLAGDRKGILQFHYANDLVRIYTIDHGAAYDRDFATRDSLL